MKNHTLTTFLLIAGLIMLTVGSFIALAPRTYVAAINYNYLLDIAQQSSPFASISIDMLSDLRGMGGMLLFVGAFAVCSVFNTQWRSSALITSTLVFSAYVLMRSIGILFDGLPSLSILIAYGIELIFACFGIALLRRSKNPSERHVHFENAVSQK